LQAGEVGAVLDGQGHGDRAFLRVHAQAGEVNLQLVDVALDDRVSLLGQREGTLGDRAGLAAEQPEERRVLLERAPSQPLPRSRGSRENLLPASVIVSVLFSRTVVRLLAGSSAMVSTRTRWK